MTGAMKVKNIGVELMEIGRGFGACVMNESLTVKKYL